MVKIVTFTADPETVDRIEREIQRLIEITPGKRVYRSTAIRLLIARGAETQHDQPTD